MSAAFETASRVSELEAQCRKTANELAEYKAESTQIKNQDLTIRWGTNAAHSSCGMI